MYTAVWVITSKRHECGLIVKHIGHVVLFFCTEREQLTLCAAATIAFRRHGLQSVHQALVMLCCFSAQKENSALRKSLDHDVEEREVEIRTLRSDNEQLKKQLIKLVRWASFLDHDLVSVFVSLSFPFQQCVFFQGSAGIVLSCLVMTVFDANGLSGRVCVCAFIYVCVWL